MDKNKRKDKGGIKMKVAIPSENGQVCPHFGHAPTFTIVDIEDGGIKEKTVLSSPGHQPGFLPVFLAEKGVELVIAGGMGAGAQELFVQNKIEVITGAQGLIDEVVKNYIAGKLVSTNHVCNEHEHSGECGGH